jgi:transposase
MKNRPQYPTDVSDQEWELLRPYLTLMKEDAPQREHSLREVFNGLRWMTKGGATWRMVPHDLPPWHAIYDQTRRWFNAGVFDAVVQDFREFLRMTQGKEKDPSAVIFDGRTLQSTPESGARAGYDGHKKKRGSKVHMAVDTIGHLLALLVTPANEQERAQVYELSERVQEVANDSVDLAFVDQGFTGEDAQRDAAENGITLEVVRRPEGRKGFVLLPRRWVVERSFGWTARFRRLSRDFERLPKVLEGFHFVAFAILMVKRIVTLISQSA